MACYPFGFGILLTTLFHERRHAAINPIVDERFDSKHISRLLQCHPFQPHRAGTHGCKAATVSTLQVQFHLRLYKMLSQFVKPSKPATGYRNQFRPNFSRGFAGTTLNYLSPPGLYTPRLDFLQDLEEQTNPRSMLVYPHHRCKYDKQNVVPRTRNLQHPGARRVPRQSRTASGCPVDMSWCCLP